MNIVECEVTLNDISNAFPDHVLFIDTRMVTCAMGEKIREAGIDTNEPVAIVVVRDGKFGIKWVFAQRQ